MAEKKIERTTRATDAEVEDDAEAVDADAQPLTETVPGGRYETADGRVVDAEGDELEPARAPARKK